MVDGESHGTHVAGMAGAHFPNNPELSGVAPGCHIVSCRIGDMRLGTQETTTSLIRGLIEAKRNNVDVINISYGEPTKTFNEGRVSELLEDLVFKHGIMITSSAGNEGPALGTGKRCG